MKHFLKDVGVNVYMITLVGAEMVLIYGLGTNVLKQLKEICTM